MTDNRYYDSTGYTLPKSTQNDAPSTKDSDFLKSPSPLQKKNVRIDQHRTTIRLEPELWQALETIALLQDTTVNEICSKLGEKTKGNHFTSAVRVYIIKFFMKRQREQASSLAEEKQRKI